MRRRHPKKPVLLLAAGLIPVAGALMAGATADADLTSSAPAAPTVADDHLYHAVAATFTPKQDAANGTSAPAGTSTPAGPSASAVPAAVVEPASVKNGDVPLVNYRAYTAAATDMAKTAPGCAIPWTVIAGIGKVESHHANNGDVDAKGQLKTPIYGPTLDGSLAGNQVITDTDGGKLDGDAVHDRAVGPMQFLPSTWEHYAADGNGDGKADPQNIFDAALTTARYLCDDKVDMRNPASETTAILRYNNSMDYVGNVLGFARSY